MSCIDILLLLIGNAITEKSCDAFGYKLIFEIVLKLTEDLVAGSTLQIRNYVMKCNWAPD